ncbi:sensor histidine kinase [Kocuria sp. ZOR0020]|uniref:sensor histidine kinase n=1 Tax=Kocuria sp. ZOR0020 TaxID=1339234 RepID=UPI00068AF3A2|nr:sensor histidine kinase [Kocuria sp. ZOR0020]
MNNSAALNQSVDPYGRPTADALAEVGYPSIWLIFMIFPTVALFQSEADAPLRVLGAAAILAFCGLYMASWWWTTPLPHLSATANAFLWCAALSLATLALVPAVGANAMSTGPFLIASLAFKLRLRMAVLAVIPLIAAFVIIAFQLGSPYVYWVPSMMAGSGFLMLGIATFMEREDQAKGLQHDLDLARQRENIGRDVHDLLGHSLTVITVKTELARKLLARDPDRAAAELDEVLALSREALGEVRATVGQLRTPEWSAQLASARTALRAARIEAKLPSPAVEIPTEQRALLAWCLRESVTNVIRHSRATRCAVEAGPGRLVVSDDGVGMASPRFGNGLNGMEDRVREAGGTLSTAAASTNAERPGLRVKVALP